VELAIIISMSLYNPVLATSRLEHTPRHQVARTLSAWSISSSAAIAVCTALGGLLADLTSTRTALAVAGLAVLASPLLLPRLSAAGLTLGAVPQKTEPELRYQDLIDDLLGSAGVTPPPGGAGFGRGAVRFEKKIFVMFVRGRLVLKLPEARVDELVAAREGVRFDANKGTPMREWFSLDEESPLPWLPLARQALDFAQAAHAEQASHAARAGGKSR
jgi:MFS family permease